MNIIIWFQVDQMTRPINSQQKKKTCRIVDFTVPADHRIKLNESEENNGTWKKLKESGKKTMVHESDSNTNCYWCARYSHQRIIKRTGGLRNKRTSRDHPNYSIVEISQNNMKSPGDSRRVAVTQTPVENHPLMLVWKTLKRVQ